MAPATGSLLIVDDDFASRALLRRYLTGKGFTVAEAPDGASALEQLKAGPFDLVLLDVEMPGASGLEVLGAIRKDRRAAELPVMMATAKDGSGDVVEALRLGANDYVTKPFDLPVVLARAQTQLSLKQALDRERELEQSLNRQNETLKQTIERLREELEAAVCVQQALLPDAPPKVRGAAFAWHYSPCSELAGDLLGLVGVDEDRAWLYVLDVVHHGVKAALLSVMINKALARLLAAEPPPSPVEVATRLNREFPWDQRTQQHFTLMLGLLDRPAGEFRFVSAGQPGPIHLPRGGPAAVLRAPGLPIGLGDGDYEELCLRLGPGDRLYLYSDGLPDAERRGEGQPFGPQRCAGALEEARQLPLAEGLTRLAHAVGVWCAPKPPHDDITILAVELA